MVEEFGARKPFTHIHIMPLVLDLLAEPVDSIKCGVVILVSRMRASIYFSVVYMAMFCFIQLKNLDSVLM
jgi:hypothetical protein